MRRTTIFKQLIINIIIPVIAALLVLAVLNITNIQQLITQFNTRTNENITDEIKYILEFQDAALLMVENTLDAHLEMVSHKLITTYFKNSDSIKTMDLDRVQREMGMNPDLEDIYIIEMETGLIVNTTFKEDFGLNVFDWGESFKNFLISVTMGDTMVSERFSIESSTKRIKKYTYQPTKDGKYIVETGNYSAEADTILQLVRKRVMDIPGKDARIKEIDLFIAADYPFSYITGRTVTDSSETSMALREAFDKMDNVKIDVRRNGEDLNYEYFIMKRTNTSLYQSSVISIVTSKEPEQKMMRNEYLKFVFIFGLSILVVIFVIYMKAQRITKPIKKLVDNVIRIRDGNLNDRAEVFGNNEITSLSEQFNLMLEQLEKYYNELEQMVADRTAEIVRQKDKIENQQKAIMDSIHYARRLQNAIMPSDGYVKEMLPSSFVLYKPKDIVSGDFYWVTKIDNRILIAAVDCTGHGVPGAFMSIVGHNHLDYAVNILKKYHPGEILSVMNERITSTMRQRSGGTNIKDGMDMALVCIDLNNNTIEYAGAHNPLVFISDGNLSVIDADKSPVGNFVDVELTKFTNHQFNFKKGDTFYIFSDGYADQFGGPKNRKYLKKNFRGLLQEIYNNKLEDQKALLEEVIENWRGDIPQIDDILVIGVRIE